MARENTCIRNFESNDKAQSVPFSYWEKVQFYLSKKIHRKFHSNGKRSLSPSFPRAHWSPSHIPVRKGINKWRLGTSLERSWHRSALHEIPKRTFYVQAFSYISGQGNRTAFTYPRSADADDKETNLWPFLRFQHPITALSSFVYPLECTCMFRAKDCRPSSTPVFYASMIRAAESSRWMTMESCWQRLWTVVELCAGIVLLQVLTVYPLNLTSSWFHQCKSDCCDSLQNCSAMPGRCHCARD